MFYSGRGNSKYRFQLLHSPKPNGQSMRSSCTHMSILSLFKPSVIRESTLQTSPTRNCNIIFCWEIYNKSLSIQVPPLSQQYHDLSINYRCLHNTRSSRSSSQFEHRNRRLHPFIANTNNYKPKTSTILCVPTPNARGTIKTARRMINIKYAK